MKDLNCLYTFNAAYYLRRVVEKIVYKKEALLDLPRDRDLMAYYDNQEYVNHDKICNRCEGCLDYIFYVKIFFQHFIDEILKMRQEHIQVIDKIEKKYNIIPNESCDKVTNFFSIMMHAGLLRNILNKEEIREINEVNENFENNYHNLCQCYYSNRISDCNDRILSIYNVLHRKDSKVEDIHLNKNDDIIYFDQNIIGKYINDKSFHNQINFLKNKECIFVYSPYLIEDAIKMDPLYFSDYCNNLTMLTDNIIINLSDNDLSIKKEEIKYSVERVKLFLPYTQASEEKEIYELKYYELMYPEFKKSGKYYQKIKENIEIFFGENLNNEKELFERLERIKYIESLNFNIEDLKSLNINVDKEKILDTIADLCKILTIINYYVESNENKKIKSSVQDNEHIKYASIVTYFVTNDKNLYKRAKIIYKIMNIKTEIYMLDDFMPYILKKKGIQRQ